MTIPKCVARCFAIAALMPALAASLFAAACGGGDRSGIHCESGQCSASADSGTDGGAGGRGGVHGGNAGGETHADASAGGQGGAGGGGAGGQAATDGGTDGQAQADTGPSDGDAGGAGGPTLSDFCTRFVDRTCAWYQACRSTQPEGCTDVNAFRTAACAAFSREVDAGRFRYFPAGGQACLDSIRTDACGFFWDASVCASAFVGQQALTDPCYNSYEQQGGFAQLPFGNECEDGYCSADSGCTCTAYAGTGKDCTDAPCDPKTEYCGSDDKCHEDIPPGGDCSSGSCLPGFACVSVGGTQKCLAARVEPGGECQGTEQCLRGDVCNNGKCVATVTSGDPCVGSWNCPSGTSCAGNPAKCMPYAQAGESCSSRSCDKNLLCDDTTHQCVAFPKVGEDCSLGGLPCVNGWCPDATPQKCRPIGKEGDDCGDNDPSPTDQRCEANLHCVPTGLDAGAGAGWQCKTAGAKGDLCESYESCQPGLYCDINVTHACAEPLGPGQAGCYGDTDCQPNLFCDYGGNGAPGTCMPLYVNGHDCTMDTECASDYCQIDPPAESGKCAADPGPTPGSSMCVAP